MAAFTFEFSLLYFTFRSSPLGETNLPLNIVIVVFTVQYVSYRGSN